MIMSTKDTVIEQYTKMLTDQGDTLGRLLAMASKAMDQAVLQALENHSSSVDLSPSQYRVLQLLCLQGMKSSDLAQRLGVSKQAVGQFVSELEASGLVKRETDPDDSRAKIIRHTKKGYKLVSELLEVTLEVESMQKKFLGKARYHQLKLDLKRLMS